MDTGSLGTLVPLLVIGAIAIFLALYLLSGFVLVGELQVGILTKKMLGKTMPQGQIIATKGEIGIQANTLMPGLHWRFPLIWKRVRKVDVIEIKPNFIGVVEAIAGAPLPSGKLLGKEVLPCNSFQDAKAFLENGGMKGPQIGILPPGRYRINTSAFSITEKTATSVEKEKIGVVVALDGTPLTSDFLVAPLPSKPDHNFFQNGQAFLDAGGYRGPQFGTLQPGTYYINPLLFRVEIEDIAEVPPGYVAVLRSNVGSALEAESTTKFPTAVSSTPNLDQPVHEATETVKLTDDNTKRGILSHPVAPGKYNMNPLAYTPYLVPTSAVTIDWAADSRLGGEQSVTVTASQAQRNKPGERTITDKVSVAATGIDKATEFFKFSQLKVTSKDGFILEVDVRLIIRISAEHAPFVIARFGSIRNLIEQIVHPLIDSSFRNKAGEKKAIEFVQSRTELQTEALDEAKKAFATAHIEAQNLLIAYILVDPTLLATQTNKEIALQQQTQYAEQAKAEEGRITLQEKKARADKQPDVIAAALSIKINEDGAEAARRKAEGERDATKTRADGDAEAITKIGSATAGAYDAQQQVIGPGNVAVIKAIQEIAAGKVVITPQILVAGGSEQGGLLQAWLATMLKQGNQPLPSPATPASNTESGSSPAA